MGKRYYQIAESPIFARQIYDFSKNPTRVPHLFGQIYGIFTTRDKIVKTEAENLKSENEIEVGTKPIISIHYLSRHYKF